VRLAVGIVLLLISGCSGLPTSGHQLPQAMTYEEISGIELRYRDCRQADFIIDRMRQQLKLRGLVDKNPEDLNQADRLYNSRVKVVIWSLIIACNNPNRYKQ
jgi:hypothetical protein